MLLKNKMQQAFVAGIIGTGVMTGIFYTAHWLGLPFVDHAGMFEFALGVTPIVGELLNFALGIGFALFYAFAFMLALKTIHHVYVKGIIYGISVWILAQTFMKVMGVTGENVEIEMLQELLVSFTGHFVYGIVIAYLIPEPHIDEIED